jgi:hypothetical protein
MARLDRAISINIMNELMARSSRATTEGGDADPTRYLFRTA